jgi:DNA-directed RNA polymerase subunit RPC12/RpoP
MVCLNCKKDLFKRGDTMANGSICAGEHIEIKWASTGEEYIECKHCKAKNFIEDVGPHTFTIGHFTVD